MEAQAAQLAAYEAKRAKMLEEYNQCITFRADPLPITKISYKIDNSTKQESMRITRNNQPLNLTLYDIFVLKMLGFSEWLEVHALAYKLTAFGLTASKKKRKRSSELIKQIFVKEDIVLDGMHMNLVPPPGVVPSEGLIISDPELTESKALASNIRRIQVRDIVKEVEDYLKTFPSAEMDISCSEQLAELFTKAFTPLSNLHISPLIPPEGLYKFACKLDTLSSLLVQMIILHCHSTYKCYTSKETCKLGLSVTVGTSDTPSNNREDGSVNVIKSDKLSSMGLVFYVNHLNGEPSKKVANLRNLITPDGNGGVMLSFQYNQS
ncbi:hypothetical protein Tco_0850985 [Tanacetum coccineum]